MGRKKGQKNHDASTKQKEKSDNKWALYKKRTGKVFKGFLKWGLILAPLFIPGGAPVSTIATALSKFIKEKLNLSIDPKELTSRLETRAETLSSKALIDETFKFLKVKEGSKIDQLKEIEIEKTLSKLDATLDKIHTDFENKPQDLESLYVDFLAEMKAQNQVVDKVLQDISSAQTTFLENFNKSMKNVVDQIKKANWSFQNQSIDRINQFSPDELLQYCKTLFEIDDIAFRFEIPFDQDKFVKFPELDEGFGDFIDSSVNSNEKRRIFLLLGHMGLGKTWNSCHLAQYALGRDIPTFFFHLGRNFESKFEVFFGPLNDPKKLEHLCQPRESDGDKPRQILLVMDGFDELTLAERNEKILPLISLIRHNEKYPNLMILLTCRRVDWANTYKISELANTISNYIYTPPFWKPPIGIYLPTKASWILEDINDDKRLAALCTAYNVDFHRVKDSKIRWLIRKPFILRIISSGNPNLLYSAFTIENQEWFEIFTGKYHSESILRRMGIIEEIETFFQEIISFIGDPYHPVREEDLKPVYSRNPHAWQIVFSSGILSKTKQDLQNVYSIPSEFQDFVNLYLLKLRGDYHTTEMCKSDAEALGFIQSELDKGDLEDYTGSQETNYSYGYVLGVNDEVTELYVRQQKIRHVPKGILKLIHLQKLILAQNDLRKIPEKIQRLRFLKELDLSNNKINLLPDGVGKLTSLEILKLNNNQITEFPESFFNLTRLRSFSFEANPIKAIPSHWNKLELLKDVKGGEHKEMNSKEYALREISDNITTLVRFSGLGEKMYRLKDGMVLDYLENLKKSNRIKNYQFEIIDKESAVSDLTLTLVSNMNLYDMFWELETCTSMEIRDYNIQFGKNKNIEYLKFQANDPKRAIKLEIDESILNLESLREIAVVGYHNLKISERIKNCSLLHRIEIQGLQSYQSLPILLPHPNIHDVFLNHVKLRSFVQKRSNFLNVYLKSVDNSLLLPSNIKKCVFIAPQSIPKKLTIERSIENLVFINNRIISDPEIDTIYNPDFNKYGSFYLFSFNSTGRIFPEINFNTEMLRRVFLRSDKMVELPLAFCDMKKITTLAIYPPFRSSLSLDNIMQLPDQSFFLQTINLRKLPEQFGQNLSLNQVIIVQPGLKNIPENLFKSHHFQEIIFSSTPIDRFITRPPAFIANEECHILCNREAEMPLAIILAKNTRRVGFYYMHPYKIPKIVGDISQIEWIQIALRQKFYISAWIESYCENSCSVEIRENMKTPHEIRNNPSSSKFQLFYILERSSSQIDLFPFQNLTIEMNTGRNVQITLQNDFPIVNLTLKKCSRHIFNQFLFNHLPTKSLVMDAISAGDIAFILDKLPENWRVFISFSENEKLGAIIQENSESFPIVHFITKKKVGYAQVIPHLMKQKHLVIANLSELLPKDMGKLDKSKIREGSLEKSEIKDYFNRDQPDYYLLDVSD